MTLFRPYHQIYDLLVDHLQDMTHQGRIAWLEQGDLRSLVASLAPDQPTAVVVPDLLTAAYHHGGERDESLYTFLYLQARKHLDEVAQHVFLEGYSRQILAGMASFYQDLTAILQVLHAML